MVTVVEKRTAVPAKIRHDKNGKVFYNETDISDGCTGLNVEICEDAQSRHAKVTLTFENVSFEDERPDYIYATE